MLYQVGKLNKLDMGWRTYVTESANLAYLYWYEGVCECVSVYICLPIRDDFKVA